MRGRWLWAPLPLLRPLLLILALNGSALAAKDARPNFVLLMSDQWRADWTSFDLPKLRTKTFAKMAAEGTRFTRATTPAPLCNPARASLATGLAYPKHGILSTNKQDELSELNQTIYQILRTSGVRTMTVGKDDLTLLGKMFGEPCTHGAKSAHPLCGTKRSVQLGFDDFGRCYGKEFVSYVTNPVDPYMDALDKCGSFEKYKKESEACNLTGFISDKGYTCPGLSELKKENFIDDWIALKAQKFIAEAPEDKPFFLQVNYAGPHPPFVVTKAMIDARGGPREWPLAHNSTSLDAEAQQLVRENYALLIENIDQLNQDILDAIAKRGDLHKTYVCMFSDHGEMLGDFWDRSPIFEPFQKSSPYQASVSVPLVCIGPGVPAGRVVEDPVSTLDLASTVLELTGATVPPFFDSASMKDLLLGGEHDNRPTVSTLDYGLHRFSTAQRRLEGGHIWKLSCCKGVCPLGLDLRSGAAPPDETDWERQLFDLTEDPLERRNLYESRPEMALALRPALQSNFASCGEAAEAGVGPTPAPPVVVAKQADAKQAGQAGRMPSKPSSGFLQLYHASSDADDGSAFLQETWAVAPQPSRCLSEGDATCVA